MRFRPFLLGFNGLPIGVFDGDIVTCVWKWDDQNIVEWMLDACVCPGRKKAGRSQKHKAEEEKPKAEKND